MQIKRKHYLISQGLSHEIEYNNPILRKWSRRNGNDEKILTVKVFAKDIHVSSYIPPIRGVVTKRGKIKKLSFGSIKRLRFLLRNTAHKMEYEVGLTYPNEFSNDGLLVKKHFHKLRMRLNYYGYTYVWILEFQGRGAPHFHMLLNKEIKKNILAKMWFDIVGSEDEKHLRRGVHVAPIRSKEGMAIYFINYMTKQDQKLVPEEFKNVGRFWGASRNLLECTVKRFYGEATDIRDLKRQLRPMRRWFDAKKRSWSKRKPFKGKKHRNRYVRPGVAFKVINSDLFVKEYEKRNIDTSLFEG